ncbi:MAG: hypothetical protein AABW50_04660 [Nanoarchaeota archaeon]
MAKIRGKYGQIYLIAAIVIIALIVGLFAVANYSKKKESTKVKDLAKELREESSQVINYEIYSSDSKIEEFTNNFSSYAGDEVEIYYLVGNMSSFDVYTHDNGAKQIYNNFSQNASTIILSVHGSNYNFNLREGKNFYFVMYQELQGEIYVETS